MATPAKPQTPAAKPAATAPAAKAPVLSEEAVQDILGTPAPEETGVVEKKIASNAVTHCPHCGGDIRPNEISFDPPVLVDYVAIRDCVYNHTYYEAGQVLTVNDNVTKQEDIPEHFAKQKNR